MGGWIEKEGPKQNDSKINEKNVFVKGVESKENSVVKFRNSLLHKF